MKTFKIQSIMGYNVFADNIENLIISNTLTIVNTLNAYSYVLAQRDERFDSVLLNSTVLVPDGFPIVTAVRFINGVRIKKIAGADIFYHYCKLLNRDSGKCFFLGSSTSTLSKICERMTNEFPNIQVSTFSPPYKNVFSEADNKMMLTKINEFSPDILFVGMTAPKQEKWVEQFKHDIKAKVVCSIGAVFDFYAKTNTRPSSFWLNLNLEWFIRLLREPRRLWKRYLIYSPLFFIHMIKYKLKKIKGNN